MGVIRGAVCAQNTVDDISAKAVELMKEVLLQNSLTSDDVEAVIFTATEDLNACYPAKAVRENLSMAKTAFMCLAEMRVEGSLDHCIRICVFAPKVKQTSCKHCYMGKAAILRSDL